MEPGGDIVPKWRLISEHRAVSSFSARRRSHPARRCAMPSCRSGDEIHLPETSTASRRLPMSPRSSDPASPISSVFLDDVLRTDGAGAQQPRTSLVSGGARDEGVVVRDLSPICGVTRRCRATGQRALFGSVAMPTLRRRAVQMIPKAGHTPQWETLRPSMRSSRRSLGSTA